MTRTFSWARAQPVLERLLALPEEEREAALLRECGPDHELGLALRRLLAAGRVHRTLFEPLDRPESGEPDGGLAAGDAIGLWRLTHLLGTGGAGEVWLAEREGADFRQQVAIKILRRGLDTDRMLKRFRRERQVLAQLAHANIPRLIDGGATADGRAYLVMDPVHGTPIDRFAREQGLDLAARLRLFAKVCDAVQHAHERGVVHRDLKPANVLVTAEGEPKLLDFGISKLLDASDETDPLDLTVTGEHMLTPRYASPEQARGEPAGPAADVYALGLLLWELLVGRPALALDALTRSDLVEAICEQPIPRPSACAAPQGGLRRELLGDLDTICAMALRKEPERRYGSARLLADDLRRHQDGLPVLARPDTAVYRASKFVRRHRVLVGATLAVLLALSTGLGIALVQHQNARHTSRASERTAYAACLEAAEGALRRGDASFARERLAAAPERLRGWEWSHLSSRLDKSTFSVPLAGHNMARSIAWLDAGTTWAYSDGRDLIVRDERSERWRIPDAQPTGITFAPRSGRLAWCDMWGGVWVLELAAGPSSRRSWVEGAAPEPLETLLGLDLAWSPDERWLAFSHQDGVRILDGATGELLHVFPDEPRDTCNKLRWHPGGELLAKARWSETVEVYDVARGEHLGGWRAHIMAVMDLDFDATGERLVTSSLDRTVKVWDFAERRELATLWRERSVQSVRFLPGGERLLCGEGSGSLTLLDWRRNELLNTFLGLRGMTTLALSPDGSRCAAVGGTDALKVWELDSRDVLSARTCEFVNSISPSPDGERFLTSSPDGYLRLWRTATCTLEREARLERGYIEAADWSRDGRYLAAAHDEHCVSLWSAHDLSLLRVLEDEPGFTTGGVAFAPDGSALTSVHAGGVASRIRIWPLEPGVGGEVLEGPPAQRSTPVDLVTRADGRPLAIATEHDSPNAWDTRGELRRVGNETSGVCSAVAVTHDDRTLALACRDEILLADTTTLEVLARVPVEPWGHTAIAFHPDGERLALATEERIEIWDPWIPLRVATLFGHQGRIGDLAWTPDGATLLSVSADGGVRVWTSR